jgi:hypothetical protein
MGAVKDRIFYHHADVSALGGYFDSPVKGHVPIQASLSLAPSGGFGEVSVEKPYSYNQLVSFDSAHTRVSGSFSEETQTWTTVASTTIRGFKILNVVQIDEMVADLVSEHPKEPGAYEPTVNASGSYFRGLKVSGREIRVDLDSDFLRYQPDPEKPGDPRTCLFKSRPFHGKVESHYNRTIEEFQHVWKNHSGNLSDGTVARPGWVAERYSVKDLTYKKDQRGMVVGSLVRNLEFKDPRHVDEGHRCYYGNVLDIQDFGRVFLAEMVVDHNTHRLVMVRAELGSPASGSASGGTVSLEGRTWP